MRLEKRRIVYGSVIGAGAFIAGVLLVWLTVPVDRVNNLPEWRAAVWVFLDAHGITIETAATQNAFRVTTEPDLPTLRIGFALPFLLVAIGAALTVSGVSGTSRLRYMIENGSAVLYGYLGVGLIALLESGAQPGGCIGRDRLHSDRLHVCRECRCRERDQWYPIHRHCFARIRDCARVGVSVRRCSHSRSHATDDYRRCWWRRSRHPFAVERASSPAVNAAG